MQKKSWLRVAIGALAALAMTGGTMFAQNGTQCKSCTVAVNNNGNLVVTYDISGLGGTTEAASKPASKAWRGARVSCSSSAPITSTSPSSLTTPSWRHCSGVS